MKYFFIAFLFTSSLFAQEIVVEGNKRSKKSFIEEQYKFCLQREVDPTEDNLAQCLMNSRLFSEVKVKKENNIVKITAIDRWTLFPLPFYRKDTERNRFGLFLMERNFLGRGKLLVVGGTGGDGNETFFSLYRDPYFLSSETFLKLKGRISEKEIIRFNGPSEVDGFTFKDRGAGALFGWYSGYSSAGLGLTFSSTEFKKLKNYQFTADGDDTFSLVTEMSYDMTSFKFYFNEGLQIELEASAQLNDRNKATYFSSRNRYQLLMFKDHALQFENNIRYSIGGSNQDLVILGSGKGFRGTIQDGLWAKRAIGFAVDYQVPLKFASYGTWTLAPFFDYGHFKNFNKATSSKDSYSYGVGGYLFLKKLALPGIGLVAGRNPNFEETFVSFSIGIQGKP